MMGVMDELTAFINARLDQWEGLAKAALPEQTGSRDEGQPSVHVAWRRSAGHPGFALRHIETLRKIVADHSQRTRDGLHWCDTCSHENPSRQYCRTLRNIAADFSTHEDYRAEWAPA